MTAYFSVEESDAFTEIFNIGAGKAALAMSELLDAPITFTVPFCIVLPLVEASSYFQRRFGTDVCIISQDFSGPFDGAALLMFHEESSFRLAQAALKSDEPVAAITELEREALTEIGNIILNACLSSFGDLLEREVATSLPRYVSGSSGAVFDAARGFDLGLVVKVDFNVEGRDIEGYVTFVLNVDSVAAFREAASRLLDRLH